MMRSAEVFHTGGNPTLAGNLLAIGFATGMIGIASRVVYGGPMWLALAIGVPAGIVLVSGLYLQTRARKMRVELDEDGLRCSDWLGRTETVAWGEVRSLQLWNRTIPFSRRALDLTWQDIRGREHTRQIASFTPRHERADANGVSELLEAIEEELDLNGETVQERRGTIALLQRWDVR